MTKELVKEVSISHRDFSLIPVAEGGSCPCLSSTHPGAPSANSCCSDPLIKLPPVMLIKLQKWERCAIYCSSEEPVHDPEWFHHVHAVQGE